MLISAISLFEVGTPVTVDDAAISSIEFTFTINFIIFEFTHEILAVRQNQLSLARFIVAVELALILDPVIGDHSKVTTIKLMDEFNYFLVI
jgi:hypothetical protein